MNSPRFLVSAIAFGLAVSAASELLAQSKDDYLRDVHSVLRVSDAQVQWLPNQVGGTSPWLTFNVSNQYDLSVLVPVTTIGGTAANWSGTRQVWIERLGPDPTIPALPRNLARNGRRYAYGGSVILWPGQIIGPRGFVSFSEPLNIGGFPSGQYAVYIEYLTTHELQLIQQQVVYLDVP